MTEMFTSTQFFIGCAVLILVFAANELYPMVSPGGMRIVAVGIGTITWLSYRGFI